MAHLTVLKFDQSDGASHTLRTVKELQDEGLIGIHDGAIVEWPVGKRKPKTRQLDDVVGEWSLIGGFWGFLFGVLFFMPILGLAIGAGGGALAGALRDVGIDDDFIKKIRAEVTEGTSALFLLTSGAVEQPIRQRFIGTHAQVLYTDLDPEEEAKLRDVFSDK
jgi:uncharacterized membrane protein